VKHYVRICLLSCNEIFTEIKVVFETKGDEVNEQFVVQSVECLTTNWTI
jgi:hypothetical protein